VSSLFFDASQKEHHFSQSAFVMAKACGYKQTGKQRWHMHLQTKSTASALTRRDITEAEIEPCESCQSIIKCI
jgi:hypothetical protein